MPGPRLREFFCQEPFVLLLLSNPSSGVPARAGVHPRALLRGDERARGGGGGGAAAAAGAGALLLPPAPQEGQHHQGGGTHQVRTVNY